MKNDYEILKTESDIMNIAYIVLNTNYTNQVQEFHKILIDNKKLKENLEKTDKNFTELTAKHGVLRSEYKTVLETCNKQPLK